ncbi:hypothetical protein BDC45DRAFT_530601 [Circinella umbellata]|nr:hypothetical protein BDC45DRAFT_530601 [Circinella umbellata]
MTSQYSQPRARMERIPYAVSKSLVAHIYSLLYYRLWKAREHEKVKSDKGKTYRVGSVWGRNITTFSMPKAIMEKMLYIRFIFDKELPDDNQSGPHGFNPREFF